MQSKTKIKGQQGFLLLEILITLILIGVLVVIAGMFIKPTLAASMASRHTVAANLAQQAIERLKADGPVFWQSVEQKADIDFSQHSQSMDTKQTVNDTDYFIEGSMEAHSTLRNLVLITITVSYVDNGRLQSVQYETYFTKHM